MIRVAGVWLSESSAAHLAFRLARGGYADLAKRLGIAITRDGRSFRLLAGETTQILAVLDHPPDGLAELRATLLAEHAARARGDMA